MTVQVRKRRRPRVDYSAVKDVEDFPGSAEVMPVDEVSSIVERYTGKALPLDRLYPEPPPEPPAQAALRAATAPGMATAVVLPPATRRINNEAAYRREHQLRVVHRMLLRNASMSQAAAVMGIPVAEAYALRAELYRRMSQEAGNMDVGLFIGRSEGFYREIRGEAMRRFDAVPDIEQVVVDGQLVNGTVPNKNADRDRRMWLVIAMASENNNQRFMQSTGVHDEVRTRRRFTTDAAEDDGAAMMQQLRGMFRDLMDPALAEQRMDGLVNGDELGPDGEPDESLITVLP